MVACKPVKPDLVYSISYTNIEKETENARINNIIAPYKAPLDSQMNAVIGYSEVDMPKQKDLPETILGDLVADAVLEFAKTIDSETDFCVLNNGGLRASLPKQITLGNVYELMPFDNEVVIVTLDGNSVNKCLSYIAERGGVPVSGLTMKLEKMNGTIVPTHVKINGKDFSTSGTYRIATSDYLSGGGDSMSFWSNGLVKTTSKKIRDAIVDFIRLKTANNTNLFYKLDSRISYVN